MAGVMTSAGRRMVLAGGLFLLLCGWAQAADPLADVRSRGVLRVAIEGTYPPFNFKDPRSGQLTGFDVELARLVGARLGVRVQFLIVEWSAVLPAVSSGKVDAAVGQVIITPAREQAFDFSTPYTYSYSQLIVRQNERANYATLADLKGRIVGVHQGSVYEQRALAAPGVKVMSYPAAPEKLQDLAFGRLDAVLDDSLMVTYLLKTAQLPIKAGPRLDPVERAGVVMPKDSPQMKRAVDAILAQVRAEGKLQELSMKWFGHDASRMP